MRPAHFNKLVVVNDNNRLLQISTGVDYCAEHEGGSKSILSFFGCKPNPSYEELMAGKFTEDSFSTSWSDHILSAKDALMLMKLKVKVPAAAYDRYASKALIKEVEDTLEALKANKTPFRCKKDMYATVLVSRHLVKDTNWRNPRVQAAEALQKKGVTFTYPELPEDTTTPYVIDNVAAADALRICLDIPTTPSRNPRAYSLLYFAREHGMEMPLLKADLGVEEVYNPNRPVQLAEGLSAYRGSYSSTWMDTGFMNSGSNGKVDMALYTIDPVVADWFVQLFNQVQEGNILLSVPVSTNPFDRGTGMLFQHSSMLSDADKVSVDDDKRAFKEMYLTFKQNGLFDKLNAKKEALKNKYTIQYHWMTPTYVELNIRESYRRVDTNKVPMPTLLAWLNNELPDDKFFAEVIAVKK